MAPGDAQRVWFPQMIETLRSQWRAELPWEALVALRDELDGMLARIRVEAQVRPAVQRCRACGFAGPAAEPHVSVRAMILSLIRFGIAPAETVYALEKSWALHRKQHGLDLYGKSAPMPPVQLTSCGHPQVR